MAQLRSVDTSALADTLRMLCAVTWPMAVDEVPRLVASLGWTVVPGTAGRLLQARTGWAIDAPTAEFVSDRLALATVSFHATDDVPDASPWRGRLLREALTEIVAVATAEFGDPTGRTGGSTPLVWWDLRGGGRIEIGVGERAVAVGAYSAEYADEIRLLAAPDASPGGG